MISQEESVQTPINFICNCKIKDRIKVLINLSENLITMTLTTVLTMILIMVFTIADINNNTDTTKNDMDNKHKNESKLMAIWQAMPTRPQVMFILGTVY
jgi:hypothetical protein